MWQQLPINHHKNSPKIIARPAQGAIYDAEKNVTELVQVVVQKLAQRAAVVGAAGLLSIDGVQGVVPKNSEAV